MSINATCSATGHFIKNTTKIATWTKISRESMLLLLFAVSNHLIKCCQKLGKMKFVKTFTFDSETIFDVDFQL